MTENSDNLVRVAIIGAGRVGATCAYTLLLHHLISELVIISANQEHAEGEVMDLNHALLYENPVRIWAGDYPDCADADIILITAGAAQRPDESRLDLLKRNVNIFREILPKIMKYTRDAVVIVVTNPVDVMTYLTWKVTALNSRQVIGSGTVLDTARLRYMLSKHYQIDPRSVHAYVIGEHGDSQVVPWSLANIAGTRLEEYGSKNGGKLQLMKQHEIVHNTRRAAYEVINRKGATYYGIAAGVRRIIEAISHDENCVLTISSLIEGKYGLNDICLSIPSIVNSQGVAKILELPLSDEEQNALHKSADVIHSAIAQLNI